MSDLSEVALQPSYHKGEDDIARDFYLPCMERAYTYDRAVGFFNSTIYVLAWPSLKAMVKREGKIRIICAPVLSKEDTNAIDEGYSARQEQSVTEQLRTEIERLLSDPYLGKPTRALATLVALDIIDFKLAFIGQESEPRHRRLFHDKVGIFQDVQGNAVVFKGSMNETWSGLALDGNLESVDVFVSWEGKRDALRASSEVNYFERLWNDQYPSVTVRSFPDVARTALLNVADVQNWEMLLDEVSDMATLSTAFSAAEATSGRSPRRHQVEALRSWLEQGRRGILEHATGSGKTFTALCAIRDSLLRDETPLILVPSELLLHQWHTEVMDTLGDLSPAILLCGAGYDRWRRERLLRIWTVRTSEPRLVIATIQTAAHNDMFRTGLNQGSHLFVVADEVHRLGSAGNQKFFEIESGPRLGLSATPRRAGDPEGTAAIFDYFGDIVPPPFTLADAIEAGFLTPYMYYPHTVELSPSEQNVWDRETRKIQKVYAASRKKNRLDTDTQEILKNMLIKRARILKNAETKVDAAVNIFQRHYKSGQRWIVYCDSRDQLYRVLMALRKGGFPAVEYHSAMEGDRAQTLKHFEINSGVVVSIRCLDEGVDIPNATHALILASSKNPREFIQRRGRVLRRAPNKPRAFVHDTIVVPHHQGAGGPPGSAIIEGELARAIKFGLSAENPSAVTELKRIAVEFDVDYEQLLEEGYEYDEDDE